MESSRTSTTVTSDSETCLGNRSPGRSIFSAQQWLSLGRSLRLSDRELEIVQCIFDDDTEAAMARRLGISAHTIHTHLERLYRKLGVASRCAAVVCVFVEHFNQHSTGKAAGRGSD